MPTDYTAAVTTVELLLLMSGCYLLWKYGLSKTALEQATAAKKLFPEWDLSLTTFLLFMWMIFCGGLLSQSLLSLTIDKEELANTDMLLAAGAAFHGGMLLGILIFNHFFDRIPSRSPQRFSAFRKAIFGAVTVLIVLPSLTAVGLVWQQLLESMGVVIEQQDLVEIFAKEDSPRLLIMMTLLAITVAPVTEEMIFRGGIFRYMRTRTPRWVALLVPALLFGALHANLASFVPLVVLGIILALAYERTGSITVPIVAHGLFNLHTIALIMSGVTA